MWKFRNYLPLLGFVVPTLVIGYGIVIPRSCIAGINELTFGFGSTIVGAVVTYVAGIRAASRTSCSSSMPWRVRLGRYINRQAALPRGVFGRLLGLIWRFEHREVNRMTLDLLDVLPHHHVLEIGCGPGDALREAARRASHAEGVDVSETMISVARRTNLAAIARGRVSLRRIEGTDLDLESASLDRVFSVHCIYFWKTPERVLSQVAAALRAGGRLVLAFRPDSADVPRRFRDDVYRFYSAAEVETMLAQAGFTDIRTERLPERSDELVWLVARRADANAAKQPLQVKG